MKRITSLLLVAILVLCAVPATVLSAFALDITTVSLAISEGVDTSYTGDPDADAFAVTASVQLADGVDGITGYHVTVKWDPSVLSLNGEGAVELSDLFPAEALTSINDAKVSEGQLTVVVVNVTAIYPENGNADLFRMNFVPQKGGKTSLSIEVNSISENESVIDVCKGDTLNILLAYDHDHELGELTVVTAPTLASEGIGTRTCSICDAVVEELIPAVKVQPDEPVDLPDGAIALTMAGYLHDNCICIIAGDNMTVGELTALGNNGDGKDMNYFSIVVVDAKGNIVALNSTLGRPDGVKTDVVCPAGGYIIGYNGNVEGCDVLKNYKVGDTVTLYNVDVDALRGVAGHVALSDAGFVITDVCEHVLGEELTIVTAPAMNAPGVATRTCEKCGAKIEAEVPAVNAQPAELVSLPDGAISLDYAGYAYGFYVCVFAGDNMKFSDLGHMGDSELSDKQVDMNYYLVVVVDATGTVVEVNCKLGRPDGVKEDMVCPEGGYVLAYNKNKDGNEVMESIQVGDKVTLYNVDLDAIRGTAGNQELTNAGFTFGKEEEPYEIGDVNGDGAVGMVDYLLIKRYYLETMDLEEDWAKRADVNNDGEVTPIDYLLIKKYVLETLSYEDLLAARK